jgi:hypothetical protein
MARAPARISRNVPLPQRKTNDRVRYKHHEFIRTLPCAGCGKKAPSECAHVRTGTDGGMGLKPSSRYTTPLCTACHRRQHTLGETTFWADLGIDPLDLSLRLWTVSGNLEEGERAVFRARQSIALHAEQQAAPPIVD